MVRAVTNDDVRDCLDMATTIELIETAFHAYANGRAVNIPRSDMILPLGEDEAYIYKVMPGAVEDLGVSALRCQSDHIEWGDDRKWKIGDATGGQYVQYVTVYDIETTEPVLIMNDGYASKMRVGATNGIGAKHLAPPETRTLGLLGAGRQADGQIWGFAEALELETIRVFSPTRDNREAFAEKWDARLDPDVVPFDDARETVRGVDVLACSTNSMAPVFEADWVEPGMHVSAIKNPEVPEAVFDEVDRVCVNSTALPHGPANYAPRHSDFGRHLDDLWTFDRFDITTEATELAIDIDEGPPREPDETTLYLNNIGLGIQFAAVGAHVHDYATSEDIGTDIDVQTFLQPVW